MDLCVAKRNYSVLATVAGLLPKPEPFFIRPPLTRPPSTPTSLLLFTLNHTLYFALRARWVTL